MKDEIRVLGVDDGPFDTFSHTGEVLVVGTVFRGGQFLDGVLSTRVEQDGNDATTSLIDMVNKSKFKPQLQAIFLDGIAFAGFNVVNLHAVHEQTGIPVVTVSRNKPNKEEFIEALDKLGMNEKKALIEAAPKAKQVENVYVQVVGELDIQALLDTCSTRSDVPEALRTAHLIAGGVVDGESTGGA